MVSAYWDIQIHLWNIFWIGWVIIMLHGLVRKQRWRSVVFRFYKTWDLEPDFLQIEHTWKTPIDGTLCINWWESWIKSETSWWNGLRGVGERKKLEYNNILEQLEECQKKLQLQPLDEKTIKSGKNLHQTYRLAKEEQDKVRSKSRFLWFKSGVSNSAFFHASIASRNATNTIICIKRHNGDYLHTGEDISNEFCCFYEKLLNDQHTPIIGDEFCSPKWCWLMMLVSAWAGIFQPRR